MRKIIVHYHFYKNAGTSVDKILQNSFNERWISCDVKDISLSNEVIKKFQIYTKTINEHTRMSSDVLKAIILDSHNKIAFSAHQIVMPIPKFDEQIIIYPIFFIRHPVDRLLSGFRFECGQLGINIESSDAFVEYVSNKYSNPQTNPFDNFHALRLGNVDPSKPGSVGSLDRDKILGNAKNLLKNISFYGIVELFDDSLKKMSDYLIEDFPNIKVKSYWLNYSRNKGQTLKERIDLLKNKIGENLFQYILDRNSMDMELYDFAVSEFFRKK